MIIITFSSSFVVFSRKSMTVVFPHTQAQANTSHTEHDCFIHLKNVYYRCNIHNLIC